MAGIFSKSAGLDDRFKGVKIFKRIVWTLIIIAAVIFGILYFTGVLN